MSEYHKIHSIYKREGKKLIEGDWSKPEFEYLANNQWVWTEKVDGTNIRLIYENRTLRLGGRTDSAQLPAKLVARLTERVLLPKLVEVFGDYSAVVYGEGHGAGIQKVGGLYRADQDLILFDVRVGEWWLKRDDVEMIAEKLGLPVVSIVGIGTLREAILFVKDGFVSRIGDAPAEGIVARPTVDMLARSGERIIAKIKCVDFR